MLRSGAKLWLGFLSRRTERRTLPLLSERRRSFELLERRELLASDMAEVVGVVRVDPQGDGLTTNDGVAVGAIARLYRDGGNGAFDNGGGDDTLAQAAQTVNAHGAYRFAGLGAGRYFVQITLPGDLQFAANSSGVKEVSISAVEAQGTRGRTIDGFTTNQRVEASPPLPKSQDGTLADGAVLGGERDLFVELTDGTDPFSQVALTSGAGMLRLASDTEVTGNAKIVWDGTDASALRVNPAGLGGIDLTHHNGNTMTGISLTSGADHANAIIRLKVYTDANNWSEFQTTVPETNGGRATQQATFNFSDLPIRQNGAGVDFARVGALELTFHGVSAVDGQVSLVGVVGRATKRVEFTAAPRLSLGDTVWEDVDNDGLLDPGERGIDGVKLNLFADVDNNNQYMAAVDRLMATTTTSGGGRYLFSDLSPGKYIVAVDAMNFQSEMALEGLRSSLGSAPAVDPDNYVNDDDNGYALGDLTVVSHAICLPKPDGDASGSRSLDFGFYGFDLVLDKDVDKGNGNGVSPNDPLVYTITIRNDGPSIAKNAQFTDRLPAGVVYVSHSTSKPSAALAHAGGVITGSLGDMASGDQVIVTVRATVGASATGVLTNEAEVQADNELFLGNNADQVQNPVTPKIDLAIVKEVNKTSANQGDPLTYSLVVTNNGPSTATGVTVVDELPGTGIHYVSASPTPASVAGKRLTFDLGTLANGGQRTIEIQVRIDQQCVGTLVNTTNVKGNEAETRLDNNNDDARTVVAALPTSVSGYVYVDRDDDGNYDANETPIGGVAMTLMGVDISGQSVTATTTTDARGYYLFDKLKPGEYTIKQTQPTRYRDGKDKVGDNGNGVATQEDGRVTPDLNALDDRDADAMEGIVLVGGKDGIDYNFGELAINVSKVNFIRSARW